MSLSSLLRRLRAMPARLTGGDLHDEVHRLRAEVNRLRDKENVFFQAALYTNDLAGDYLEFGVMRGRSFREAYFAFQKAYNAMKDLRPVRWRAPRLFAFDSFEGLPDVSGVDQVGPFGRGQCLGSQEEFIGNLKTWSVDLNRVVCVKGWYETTLTEKTRTDHHLTKARFIHIDCDLYESAKQALAFVTPITQEGTIVLFDDWLQFRGNPEKGEQRAFREWLEENPWLQAVEFMRRPPWGNSFVISYNEKEWRRRRKQAHAADGGHPGQDLTFGLGRGATLPFTAHFARAPVEHFAPRSGCWVAGDGKYSAAPLDQEDDALSLLLLDQRLGPRVELRATISAGPKEPGYFSNGFLVFDYRGPLDFKYAGASFGRGRWVIGHRTLAGWGDEVVLNEPLAAATAYDLQVSLEGATAALQVDGVRKVSFTFDDPLNDGSLGLATYNSRTDFSNVQVC